MAKRFTIVCRNNSRDNKYIQSIRLNGQPLQQVWFRHADIVNGGTLELQMGNTPNKELGALPATFPPSRMNLDPANVQPGAALAGVKRCGTRRKLTDARMAIPPGALVVAGEGQ